MLTQGRAWGWGWGEQVGGEAVEGSRARSEGWEWAREGLQWK